MAFMAFLIDDIGIAKNPGHEQIGIKIQDITTYYLMILKVALKVLVQVLFY